MKNLTFILTIGILLAVVSACSTGTKTTETTNSSTETKTAENKTETSKPNPTNSTVTSSEIAGNYTVNGASLEGKPYQGELVVTKRDDVYQFSWTVGTDKYDGVGILDGDKVAAAYTTGTNGKGCGAVIYKINSDDSLEGKWGEWGVNESGKEKAVPTEKTTNSSGKFDVSGTNANGSAYKGKLSVERESDDVYQFSWDVGTKYIGTGVKLGNYLAAGSGSKQCGFVIYEVKNGNLEGKWGVPGTAKLGNEKAAKK